VGRLNDQVKSSVHLKKIDEYRLEFYDFSWWFDALGRLIDPVKSSDHFKKYW